MIPKISDLPQLDPIYAQYLNALKVSALKVMWKAHMHQDC